MNLHNPLPRNNMWELCREYVGKHYLTAMTIEAAAGPRVHRKNRPIFVTYISTVSATSTNSAILSKFM